MRKDTSIFSELQEFFQQNDSHRAIIRIVGIMRSLHIHEKQIINRQLITRLSVRTDSKKSGKPVCIVADDTDLPKTGKHMELMGRVHSHVLGISRLGFKGLFLARTDGKTQTMLRNMITHVIKKGQRFDYLLIDSWFTCKELVHYIKRRHFVCHLLGMIKMGKTKYHTEQYGDLTAKGCIDKLKRVKKGITRHRSQA